MINQFADLVQRFIFVCVNKGNCKMKICLSETHMSVVYLDTPGHNLQKQ